MKLKCQPEDFRVQERCRLPLSGGEFAVYELSKQSLGTLEAIDALVERWRLPRPAVQFAGLKDKHAQTRQTITIQRGPRRSLTQSKFEVRYAGQAPRAIEAADIEANEFRIVVRDLPALAAEQAMAAGESLAQMGVPNYFDDQRFGSLGEGGEFIARPWCLGNWERTIWLIIADASEHDSPEEREQKRLLRVHWGDWEAFLRNAPRSRWRNVAEYLSRRPTDFRGAIACVRQDLRSLYLAAYQSDLWNGMLASLVEGQIEPAQRISIPLGRRQVPFWTTLPEPLQQAFATKTLPLPSSRLHNVDEPTHTLIDQVLQPEGLELRQLRVKYPRDSFFSKGDRPVLARPAEFASEQAPDELYPGRMRLDLQFHLPRGAYATVVVKRLFGH